jgi:type IV secretory pathway VirJ component
MILSRSRRIGNGHHLDRKPHRGKRIAIWSAAVLAVALLIASVAPRLGLLGSAPFLIYPAHGRRLPIAAVLMSGDIGFTGGMSAHVGEALAQRGMTVVGVSSPAVFGRRRTPDEALAVVEQAIHMAMRITGAPRVVLVGQSYGADIMATVLPRLPPGLLARVEAIDLLVPGRDVYFRADPLGLEYMGEPDAHPANGLLAMRGPPMICIWGVEETDSLCPQLKGAATIIGLPGNHHLHHDHVRLIAAAMGGLHKVVPAIRP